MIPMQSICILSLFAFIFASASAFPTPGPFQNHIIQILNGDSDVELWYDLIANHPGAVSDAALYAYSIGEIDANWTLPSTPPYGYTSFMSRLVALPAPGVRVTPVILCGGPNLEHNFAYAELWAAQFVAAAEKYGFSGFVLDGELSKESSAHTQGLYMEFLNTFSDALHKVNKTLAVVVRDDFPKAIIAQSHADSIMPYYYANLASSIEKMKTEGQKYGGRVCMQLEPKSDWEDGGTTLYAVSEGQHCKWISYWSNFEGNDPARMPKFYYASRRWTLNGTAI